MKSLPAAEITHPGLLVQEGTTLPCQDKNPELWFSERAEDKQTAIDACMDCGIVKACMEWAIATKQPDGIWGATTLRERNKIRKNREEQARESA